MNLKLFLSPLLCAGLFGMAPLALAQDYTAARAQFRIALDAVEKRQPLPEITQELRDYPLFPYLAAQQLRQSLDAPQADTDTNVAEFLKTYADQPMTRPLRREWWASLATREQWPRYLAEVPATVTDAAQQCSRFTGLLKTGSGPELNEDILKLWITGDSRPAACSFPFDWLKQQGQLTEERRARRARNALDAGNLDLAEMMIAGLPPENYRALAREARLLRDPARELPILIEMPEPGIPVDSVMVAWNKLIRGKPQDVEPYLYPLLQSQQIDPSRAGEFMRQIALGYSWNRDPAGMRYFLAVPDGTNNEASFEWRVRTALWIGDWPRAMDWISRMPADLAAQPRWRYWLARCTEMNGGHDAAEKIYLSLLDGNNYYAVLASVRLQAPLLPRAQPQPQDPEAQAKLAMNPALIRAREWYFQNRPELARSEWNYALDGADKSTLVLAARIASGWGWQVQAIGTAARAAVFDDYALLYPRPWESQVRAGAQMTGIPSAWIYGVIRQESLYDPKAVSKRDAYGLMQLLLPTARSTSARWRMRAPSRDDLFDPDTNVLIGSAELRDMSDKFGNRFMLALAAYNAGPTAVTRWLPAQPMDADVWIENIPFNETRAYVQKIMWHIAVFGWREAGQPQDLSALLLPVALPPPATTAAPAAAP